MYENTIMPLIFLIFILKKNFPWRSMTKLWVSGPPESDPLHFHFVWNGEEPVDGLDDPDKNLRLYIWHVI